jgi:hypothetical protein
MQPERSLLRIKEKRMTYNFDPQRWYDNELALLEHSLASDKIDAQQYDAALEELNRRYEQMLDRLDGTYQLPDADGR